jgi:Peptidase M15.
MGDLSAHFDKSEFRCKCGCGGENPSKLLIEMLEKLFKRMNARAIIISSGYRCPYYSPTVGGYRNDAHTQNIAADLRVKKQDGSCYSSSDVAEAAEREGFGGIGIIDDTHVHLDTRGKEPYVNSHWFGNEVTGEEYSTFQRGTVFDGERPEPVSDPVKLQKKVTIMIDDHQYSGLLTED